jgi:hypothetical protein
MNMPQIEIIQTFNQPIERVFTDLSDHATFGHIIGANIQRIKDSNDADKNGLGSIRLIKSFPALPFEETIVAFEANKFIAYEISKGSPLKNHRGELHFYGEGESTKLAYTIRFVPKVNFPMWGALLKSLIDKPIRKGLKLYAEKL